MTLTTLFVIGGLLWLATGLFGYGVMVAWANRTWVKLDPSIVELVLSVASGPISLGASLAVFGYYNPEFRYHTKEDRWEIYKQHFPTLEREDFEFLER